MKKMLQLSFLAVLVAVIGFGFVAITEPAVALKPAPGPQTDCPSITCPSNTSGWVWDGTCTTWLAHDCVEECAVLRNTTTGQRCKQTTNCAWW